MTPPTKKTIEVPVEWIEELIKIVKLAKNGLSRKDYINLLINHISIKQLLK